MSRSEKMAIVGINGVGKSTFLKICAGLEEPDDGEVVLQRGVRVVYVPQTSSYSKQSTIAEILDMRLQESGSSESHPCGKDRKSVPTTGC